MKVNYLTCFRKRALIRRALECFLSTLLIWGGYQLAFPQPYATCFHPVTGVALSLLFLRGDLILASIALGTFLSYYYNHITLLDSILQAFLFTVFVYFTRLTALKWIGPVAPLFTRIILLKFLFVLVLWSVLYSFFSTLSSFSFPLFYFKWIHTFNGLCYITPLCLIFDLFLFQLFFQKQSKLWMLYSLLLILANITFYFLLHFPTYSLFFSVIYLLLFTSFAFYFGKFPSYITLLGNIVLLSGIPLQINSNAFSTHSFPSLFLPHFLLLQASLILLLPFRKNP